MKQRNRNSHFMQRLRGKLYGTVNMGQQEYDVVLSPKGVKPSVASPIRIFLAFRANSGSKLSKAFHTSESEGCTITSLFSPHHLCATAYESQFFSRETFVSVEVQWACNELAYVQPLLSLFHHHHLLPRRSSVYHILIICFLPCVPSKKAYNYLARHQSSDNPYQAP
jgi:hypothetical protein